MQYYLERIPEDFDGLAFDPLCRMACAMPGIAGVEITVEGASRRWSHACGGVQRHLVGQIAFGPDDIGTLALLDESPREASEDERIGWEPLRTLAHQLLALQLDFQVLSRRQKFYQLLADASTETIVRADLDGVRRYFSPSIRELLGYEPDELIGTRAADITHPDDIAPLAALMKTLREGQMETAVCELRQQHKNGSWVWIEASLRLTRNRNTGEPDGYVVSVRSIDRRKAYEARLERLAGSDELTGLPNRALFRRLLDERLTSETRFALLYMDLDGFKQVNDQLGHHTGDMVLRALGVRLASHLRTEDVVARLGGDEFTALIDMHSKGDTQGKNIAALCERLIAAAATPFSTPDGEITVGLSIGIATSLGNIRDADMLLFRADRALYEAKNAGKNTYRFADPAG
ncbi:diguanylate cyclase [Novosphingobium nitrogenifigens DSM 19370]|uniref:Diguanylate cyclase n=1 Tax=Novosphingobium nitrogenifigens DSM 19370 TaxID=983920 RepID=F1Z3W4_9SPHN|nr:sensor domain-containing diguanylate cyclase [Novosphingobium nitrogenifigens]EGD60712.1 diguanylate cyclase [Novosphingobium nitrogenifigens DSM 19370]